MLQFHGIQLKSGAPQRFKVRYNLKDSLMEAFELYRQFADDSEKALQSIDRKINDLFKGARGTNRDNGMFRYQTAHLNRVKDILHFYYKDVEYRQLKTEVSMVLTQPIKIQAKWEKLEAVFEKKLSLGTVSIEEILSDPQSELFSILQLVTLIFMDQDEELPPPNLLLKFVPRSFPAHKWISTDTLNYESQAGWTMANPYCRFQYLSLKLHRLFTPRQANEAGVPSKRTGGVQTPGLEQFDETPTTLKIEYADEDSRQDQEQLSLIPESPDESLLSFQRMLQKKYTHEGVKHFLAVLRQISSRQNVSTCYFDIKQHLALVASANKKGEFHAKQLNLFYSVLEEMKRLTLVRRWEHKNSPYETRHPFIAEVGKKYYSEETRKYPMLKLVLDRIFSRSEENPFQLGSELRLIPEQAFKENTRQHNLVPVLSAYFSGTWLHEFPQNKGVASKTAEEIIQGCAVSIPPSAKYRMIHKLKSELAYMSEKQYIGNFTLKQSGVQNPWKDVYSVQAPVEYLSRAQVMYQQLNQVEKGMLHA